MKSGFFGVHVTIDGYKGDYDKLNSGEVVFKCLDELPEKVGMKNLITPIVVEAPAVSEKDSGGFSGFVIIATSHISIHTFPKRGFVSIDAYTCQEQLDTDFVINYFVEAFGLKDKEVNIIQRATRFPDKDLY